MTIPRFGAPPGAARRHRLRPGVYAVIRHGRGVLLTLQDDGDGPPEVQLPGGGIDPGEQPLEALRREVVEETGWSLGAPRRLGAYRVFKQVTAEAFANRPVPGRETGGEARGEPGAGKVWAEKLCTVYAARAGRALGPPTEAGHAVVVLDPAAARLALACEGARSLLDRARALGLA